MGAPVLEEEKKLPSDQMKPLATERAIEKIMRMETLCLTFRLRQLAAQSRNERRYVWGDIAFDPGLNVIWADNTCGKSTCLQAYCTPSGLKKC